MSGVNRPFLLIRKSPFAMLGPDFRRKTSKTGIIWVRD
jgi:hypothetical protein